jgi:iron-sulfur cluster repair protein YtfE (RIC family)
MRLDVPDVLKREHVELFLRLEAAAAEPGAVGEAAQELVQVLNEHLKREEQVAFPLLGLLPHLVDGTVGEEMRAAVPVTDRLRAELHRLRREHVAIVAAVERLAEAGRKDGRQEFARLAQHLLEHARVEEAILYPAALIVGEYVRLKLRELDGATIER